MRVNPDLGIARDDLREGLRGLLIDQHRALYIVLGDSVNVLRIL